MIKLITPFFHHLIQILNQIIIKMLCNPILMLIQCHNTHIHIYYNQIPQKIISLHQIKEHPIHTLYNLLKGDPKILHFHIYLLTLYIK